MRWNGLDPLMCPVGDDIASFIFGAVHLNIFSLCVNIAIVQIGMIQPDEVSQVRFGNGFAVEDG